MRYIDPKHAVEKRFLAWKDWHRWCEKVEQAKTELEGAKDHEARSKLLRQSRLRHWAETKAILKAASFDKCWFCEAPLPGKAGDVDHFRPKSGVAEDKAHEGYWWRAFDWKNFRLACTKCNRLETNPGESRASGKGRRFPLLNPEQRAHCDQRDCDGERPGLLDPIVRSDVKIVDFAAGRRICTSDNEQDNQRYEWSTRYYNWHRPELCEELAVIFQEFRDGLTALESAATEQEKDRLMDRLIALIQPDKPFSHAAKRFLLSLEKPSNKEYVQEILTIT